MYRWAGSAALKPNGARSFKPTARKSCSSNHYDEATERNILDFLIFDERNLSSIRNCLYAARENGRMVRETLSTSVWEALNRFYLRVQVATKNREAILRQPHEFLDTVKDASHLMLGAKQATISHGEAWNFMRLGTLLERADKTSRILDVKYFILLSDADEVGSPLDTVQWAALLKSTGALTMYRRRFGGIAPERVAEFLILNRAFPRSIHHCVTNAERAVHEITGVSTDYYSNPAEQYLGKLRYELTFLGIDDVISQGMHQFIDSVQVRLKYVRRGLLAKTSICAGDMTCASSKVPQFAAKANKPRLTCAQFQFSSVSAVASGEMRRARLFCGCGPS